MSLNKLVKTFIFAIAISTIAVTLAESAQRVPPPAKPESGLLAVVGDGFIISGERKYLVTSKTVIKNKRGKKISVRLLKLKSKLQIEFKFVEVKGFSVPQANFIKVLSEP